jgi:hypothetical protein
MFGDQEEVVYGETSHTTKFYYKNNTGFHVVPFFHVGFETVNLF